MKIVARDVDGTPELILSEVYSGVGIETDMGLFGIAQRDGGIEVMLDGKTVWTSHELSGEPGSPPDLELNSPELRAAEPRQTHWFYAEGPNNPPTLHSDADLHDQEFVDHVRAAARFAVRASTACGQVDPDAVVKNMIIGVLGLLAPNEDGTFTNPKHERFAAQIRLGPGCEPLPPDGSDALKNWTIGPGRVLRFNGRPAFRVSSDNDYDLALAKRIELIGESRVDGDERLPAPQVDEAASVIADLLNQSGVTVDSFRKSPLSPNASDVSGIPASKAKVADRFTVVSVENTKGGWRLRFDHPTYGLFWIEVPGPGHLQLDTLCDVVPRVGEEIVFGKGEERRGVTVGGRVYVTSWPPVAET